MGEKDGLEQEVIAWYHLTSCMMTALCHDKNGPKQKTRTKTHEKSTRGQFSGCKKATKLSAETRDPPSKDPRDHKEQPFRHDIHPDTLKQKPTTLGPNKSGEKSYRSETGE